MPGPSVGPMARAQACGLARHAYPVPVGVALARARAARTWRSSEQARTAARRSMDLVVGATARAPELEELARRHLYETYRYRELVWRTGVVTRLPVGDLTALRAPAAAGRGVHLSVVHQGQFGGHPASLARHGFPMAVLVAPRLFEPQPATASGLLRRQLLTVFSADPRVTPLPSAGSFDRAVALLRAGGTLLLGCDLPGSTPVRFLGRTVHVPSGTARLAMATGAPVVPVSVAPYGGLERLEVQPALLPQDFDDPLALLQAVVARHEAAVLAWPDGLERPHLHLVEDAPARQPASR